MCPKLAFAIAIILSISCNEITHVLGDIRTASSYNPPYTPTRCNGNRQDQFPSGNLFVQVSEGLWDNGAACGRRYRLRCLSGSNRPCRDGTVDVRVVDFCTKRPCPSTIVMSSDAFAAVSRSPDAKINIEFIQYVAIDPYEIICSIICVTFILVTCSILFWVLIIAKI